MNIILVRYVPLLSFFLALCVIRWLSSPQSRRLQLFGSTFAGVAIVAVLGVERLTVGADWLRLAVLGFWLVALLAVAILKRKSPTRGEEFPLFVATCIFTGALVSILFGIQRSEMSHSAKDDLGYLVLVLAALGVLLVGCIAGARLRPKSETADLQEQHLTKH